MVTNWRSPIIIISSGCLIAMFGFGTRSMFGFFLEPMTEVHVWSREQFSLAMAIQNLLWGLTVPIAGAVADKYGPMRVLMLGAVFYSLGIIGMANSETALSLNLFGGLLTGIGVITKPATHSMKWSIGWTRPVRITVKSEAVPVISSMH